MMINEIEIEIDHKGKGFVKLNGNPLYCKGISIESTAGKLSEVSIRILANVKGKLRVEEMRTVPAETIEEIASLNDTYSRRQVIPLDLQEQLMGDFSGLESCLASGLMTINEARAVENA